MRRIATLCLVALAVTASTARAQDSVGGAGRVEVAATPIGGVFFMPSKSETEPKFGNYGLGGSIAGNINRFVGVEGDVTFAVGVRQDLTFTQASLLDQKTPNMLNYSGNLIYSPWGSNRSVVPYVAGGVGALTMFNTTDVENLGVTTNETFLTSNVGGGVRWFSTNGWGLRGDYRAMIINRRDEAPVFFGQEKRLAHRVSASIIFTY